MRKIHILHLHTSLNYSCGITKIINLTVKNLNKNYIQHVLCYKNNTKSFSGYKVDTIKTYNNFMFDFIFTMIYLYKYIKGNKIEIINSHHRKFDLIVYILSKIISITTVTFVHNIVYGKRLISYNSKYLIAVSNKIRNHLTSYYKKNPSSIILINNYTDPGEWVVKKKYDSEIFRIGYAGRINEKEKGTDILLEAFDNLEIQNKKLILAGKIEDNAKFIDIHRDKVNYLGEIEDLNEFYNSIDVFVLPSREESFGIVILEAGVFKLPVVASRLDGITEIITDKENGLLFEQGNSAELAIKLMSLYKNVNLRTELGEKLKRKVINDFSKDKILIYYRNLYERILHKKQ